MKRLTLLFIVGILACLTVPARAQVSGKDMEGTWVARWTFTQSSIPSLPPGAGFNALHAFHQGGTVTSVDDDFFDSPGVGEWQSNGRGAYTFAIAFFAANDQSPSHSAPFVSQVKASVIYDAAKDRWSGTFKSFLLDRDLHVLAQFAGEVVATRIPR